MTISSTRANATREMQVVNRHVKTLSQEMASGKQNVTSISSLGLIQRNLLQTQGNILEGAVAAAATHRTNLTLAINALNAAFDILQAALDIANTCALDPTANIAQLSAEYSSLVVGAANSYLAKTLLTTKNINGDLIFPAFVGVGFGGVDPAAPAQAITAQVSPVAGDTITITPIFNLSNLNHYQLEAGRLESRLEVARLL